MRAPQRPFAAIVVVTLLAAAAAFLLFVRTPGAGGKSPDTRPAGMGGRQQPFAVIVVVWLLAAAAAFILFARSPGTGDVSAEAGVRPASGPTGNSPAWMALLAWPEPEEAPAPADYPPAAAPDERAPPEAQAPPQAASEPASAAVARPPVEPPAPPVPREWLDPDFAAQVLALVNGERAARGIAPLASSGALTQGAQDYARTLTQLGTLSHTAVGDLTGRVLATGYTGHGDLGEALWFGGGAVSPGNAVAAWLASPPHSGLLLDAGFVAAGAGCYFYEAGSDHQARCVLILGG